MALLSATPAEAVVLQSLDDFLARMSPAPCRTTREPHYLTAEQKKQAEAAARGANKGDLQVGGLWVRYRLRCPEKPDRFIYFESHRVRTQPETLAVVVGASSNVERVEVLAFNEPQEYIPGDSWFGTFQGSDLNPALELQRRIPMITGATLSARAALGSVRRVLAVHEEIARQ